jgi:CheY-like chemotaxis protein
LANCGPPESPPDNLALALGRVNLLTSTARSVLWIDDEIRSDDAIVRLLECAGRTIRCVKTGEEGLRLAAAESFDQILLDLGLPDTPGHKVLARLRAAGIVTPVIIVTGYPTLGSAFTTGRFGASAFVSKPVLWDELVGVLDNLPTVSQSIVQGPDAEGISGPSFGSVANLIAVCDRVASASPSAATSASGNTDLITALLRAIVDPSLPVSAFIGCAEALRSCINADVCSSQERALAVRSRVFSRPKQLIAADDRVKKALESMRQTIAQGVRPAQADVAAALHVHSSHLGRLILADTGLSFSGWRCGFTMQAAVQHLVNGNDRVKHISGDLLGFEHQSEFDRQFHSLFGLAPTAFRRLWKCTC